MIKYLKYKEINKEKWDECIKYSFNGIVYAYSWYLNSVCENWDALIEDDYERVFPLVYKKKFGISYLYQPFFTQQLGVFSRKILTAKIVDKFLKAIPSKYKFIDINLNTFNKVNPENYTIIPQLNHELDLINSYHKIYKNYSQNNKRNIKKAEKAGVTIIKNIKPEDIINIFRQNRGKTISNLNDEHYLMLKRFIYIGIYKGLVQVSGAYTNKNELCAGAFFIKSNNKIIFLFSGINSEARENNAMSLLIDTFIRENCQNHITLDFEGSNDPNLARFYISFGSKKCTYFKININRLPILINIGVRIAKRLRKMV